TRVRVLHDDDPRILPETRVELAGADVDRVYACRTLLQQAVSEAARGGADVEADPPGHLDLEVVERVDQLLAAAAHVGTARAHLDRSARSHKDARFIH